jgi:Zn-dependent peptidase ImmA (M78 family)
MNPTTDFDLKKRYAILALKWCRVNFGVCTRKRRKLKFEISDRKREEKKSTVFGVYCFYKNKITIYEPNCNSLYEIVATIIHEYTHYLQSRTQYAKYEKTHFYSTNPLEKEAKRNEKKYTKICINEINKNFN